LYDSLNHAGQKLLSDTLETEVNDVLRANQFFNIFRNVELDESLVSDPEVIYPRANFRVNGSFVAETTDGKKVRAEASVNANSFVASDKNLKFGEGFDLAAGINAGTINSMLNVLQKNDVKVDFRDIVSYVSPYTDTKL
jgi:hypothetical protein